MTERVTPFSLDQIGTGAVRFPSGAPIPSITDTSVDPYSKTRIPKEVQVEALQFWPQVKGVYPGIVVLHEWWGLNSQIKDLANRLACEGFGVIVPNLYVRQGGMVTANAEVAEMLMNKTKESDLLQDVNSCCEFLNTRDHVKRNVHGVVGFGVGGSLALRFACQRKRLRTAVSFYGKVLPARDFLKDLYCPVQYHRGTTDEWVNATEMEQLREAGREYNKRVDIHSYDGVPHAFCNETRKESYRPEAMEKAWEAMITFLNDCFKADMKQPGT